MDLALTMDKIAGDAVHAIFGAPLDQSNHASLAVQCALNMDVSADELRARKLSEGVELGVTRIGVHSGTALAGNFGGEGYFDYTAHGDEVNTAARLEGANKHWGTRLFVSGDAKALMPGFVGRPVGSVVLPGKTEAINLFEPLSAELAESKATREYMVASEKLESCEPLASQAFAAYVAVHGEDPLATFHLKRLLSGETGVRIVLMHK